MANPASGAALLFARSFRRRQGINRIKRIGNSLQRAMHLAHGATHVRQE
ncbi:hypothetical protein [Sphingomonas zeae]|uniref:Uncharacterized protein n=1 Tax=Sphingomonas zeae TaxID=1646122 RepID=A0A7Y6B219_9SPHN|nr:hypothetical protein [Sphingomonas zeae]